MSVKLRDSIVSKIGWVVKAERKYSDNMCIVWNTRPKENIPAQRACVQAVTDFKVTSIQCNWNVIISGSLRNHTKHGKSLITGFRGHLPHKKWGFNFLARLKEFQTRYFICRHDPRTSHQIKKSFKTTRLLCVDPWHEIGLSSSSFIIINYCLRKSLRHLF